MKFTIKNYYYFKNGERPAGSSLLSEAAWGALRADNADTPFSLPRQRELWITKALKDDAVRARAQAVARLVKEADFSKLYSPGCGCAFLEYNIKALLPGLALYCSDSCGASVEILASLFIEAEAIQRFDIASGAWRNESNALYLLHRVDTEFDDARWRQIFVSMHQAQVKHVLFIPGELLGVGGLIKKRIKFFLYAVQKKKPVFVGYSRTKESFMALWKDLYVSRGFLPMGGLKGFFLERSDG
jgi:hypothetical protein